MACCNQRRQAARPRTVSARPVAAPFDPDAAAVVLRYLGSGTMRVQGPRSAQVYTATTAKRLLRVDARDVDALLRTGAFAFAS